MTYFNTTQETGPELKKNQDKSESQDKRILKLFDIGLEEIHSKKLSASLIHRQTGILLTSVRRSLHTLEHKKDKLRRLNVKITGLYGRSEYLYTKI